MSARASLGEIQAELALVGSMFPGRLSPETAAVWSRKLEEHNFACEDLAAARSELAEEQAAARAEGEFWALEIGSLIAAARRMRASRLNRENQRSGLGRKALPAPGATTHTKADTRAKSLVAKWVCARVIAGRAPTEEETERRLRHLRGVLDIARGCGREVTDAEIETALAAGAIGRVLCAIGR